MKKISLKRVIYTIVIFVTLIIIIIGTSFVGKTVASRYKNAIINSYNQVVEKVYNYIDEIQSVITKNDNGDFKEYNIK